MPVSQREAQDATLRLHGYLFRHHWRDAALTGPDAGVRWNARLGRFVKSYVPWIAWSDDYVFLQAQGYWILANWLLCDALGDPGFAELATSCAHGVADRQAPEGFWEYPALPSRRGKIATVEGNWASLGLLESYRRGGDERLLAAAKRWYGFLDRGIGFERRGDLLAINYFAGSSSGLVPNNTTLTLWTLAELASATGDDRYLAPAPALLAFLRQAQQVHGELPYAVGDRTRPPRPHFLCFQYNAFEFLDLAHYHRLTGDRAVAPMLKDLAGFLATGVGSSGAARYSCSSDRPEVNYYTAAVAAALDEASQLGLGDFAPVAERAFRRVLDHVTAEGTCRFFSRGDYGFLTDRRSYPRNLAMILYHLTAHRLCGAAVAGSATGFEEGIGGQRTGGARR